jgi:predicted permease
MALPTDVRHALRLLARSRLFALTAVGSLSLGVAASSTVFSVADALVGPAAGVREPSRVVDVGRGDQGQGFDNMSHPAFEYLRRHATTLDGLAGLEFGGRPIGLTIDGASERVFSTLVSANFFEVLGTRPALGRFFRADEDQTPGAQPVVVLTHRLWLRRLGGDPAVLDRPLRLNNRDFTVVGVAEPGFEGVTLAGTDLWLPMAMLAEARGLESAARQYDARGVWHVGVGRLKACVSRRQAEAELNTLMDQFKAATLDANPRHTVALLATSRVPGPMRTPFLAFLAAMFALAAALLAIACSNVAGMLLARATARRREMATRLAIGGSRARLLTQLLTETALLFLLAGLAAVPLTAGGIRLLNASLPALPVAVNLDIALNARVVAFALTASLLTALVFGLAPARHALGQDLAPLLHGGAATTDRRRLWLRHGLVVAQVALSMMLVATAGLFVRTLQAAARVDPGFRTTGVALANVDIALAGYRGRAAVALVDRYESRAAALPGVTAVAAARMVPLQGSGLSLGRLRVPGYRGPAGDDAVDADWNVVTPGFFDVVQMPIVDGRGLRETDGDGTTPVVVVNQTLAREVWPGRSAVGQRLLHRERGAETPLEVVGVVADARYRYISDAPEPFVFVPLAQHPVGDVTLFVGHAPGASLAAALRAAMAATARALRRTVMLQAAWLAAAGAVVGLLLATGVGRLLRPLLVGVGIVDVPSAAAAVVLFSAVLAGASWRPARQAATTDPAQALRTE